MVLIVALGLLLHAAGDARAKIEARGQVVGAPLTAVAVIQCQGAIDLFVTFKDGRAIEFRPGVSVVYTPGAAPVKGPEVPFESALALALKAPVQTQVVAACKGADKDNTI